MLDTLAEAWAADNDGANIWADPRSPSSTPSRSPASSCARSRPPHRRLEGRDPRPRERVDHILTKQVFGIGITHLTSLHGPSQRLLLKVRRRRALGREVVRRRATATSGSSGWSTRGTGSAACTVSAEQASKALDRGDELRDARLCVHPHRRHQGSARRAVWRRHAVRRHHRQPAVPARDGGYGTSAAPDLPAIRRASARPRARVRGLRHAVALDGRRQGTRQVPGADARRRPTAQHRRLPEAATKSFPG